MKGNNMEYTYLGDCICSKNWEYKGAAAPIVAYRILGVKK